MALRCAFGGAPKISFSGAIRVARLGLMQENCPHRGTSLFAQMRRNHQRGGLRCCYHGWKFDVEGRCIDMPSDTPGSNYKDKVRATPTR